MRAVCFYFQVHQPYRLKKYRFFNIGNDHYYDDEYLNRSIMERVADQSYLPMNQLLLNLIKNYPVDFKVSFSISGMALEQFEQYSPQVIESFKKLAQTGNVEFLTETYAHSLVALKDKKEFKRQVQQHSEKIEQLFGVKPLTFRNTELIYSDEIGEAVNDMGFETMLTEGAKHILGWKSPNYVYEHAEHSKLKLLLKNYSLSDDIAFRFSTQDWSEWPLTTEKYLTWLKEVNAKDEVVNLFMDYETFGEHQWAETGIFDFMRILASKIIEDGEFTFLKPSEVTKQGQSVGKLHVPNPISWADEERDVSAWLGNEMQDEAFGKLYALAPQMLYCENEYLKRDWLKLQTSDHFYYMCTKWYADGDVHKYFNPYPSPYEAFINYMNVLADFQIRLDEEINLKSIDGSEERKILEESLADMSIINELSLTKFRLFLKEIRIKDLYVLYAFMSEDLKKWTTETMQRKKLKEFQLFTNENQHTLKDLNNAWIPVSKLLKKIILEAK
ncbi:MAG: alpha-amylase [Bacteroidetes bacterium 4572_77]|nr:MAG: alpha-amylase [Bacteroidetes bacterium 4572_77]